MADRLRDIQARILEWWNKYTSKQKTIIIGVSAGAIFAFTLFIYFISRPQYTELYTAKTTAEASEITGILDTAGIRWIASTDGLRIEVPSDQEGVGNLALGAGGFIPAGYSLNDVTSGGFSVTEADKQRRYKEYLEKKLASDLETYSSIRSARITLNIPEPDGTLLSKTEESSASVRLELADDSFTVANAANVARAIATALGNKTTANITITDTNANLLFSGVEDFSIAGIAASLMDYQNQMETVIAGRTKKVVLNTRQYDMVEVAVNLSIDRKTYSETIQNYTTVDGRDVGYLIREETHDSENTGGTGGVPGADSNDGTTEMYRDLYNTSASTSERLSEYIYDHAIRETSSPAGAVIFEDSSIVVTLIRHSELREEDARSRGLLDGTSWEEYKYENREPTRLEVDEDFYGMVANASGIGMEDVGRISIIAYERPLFYDRERREISPSTILSLVLGVIVLAVGAFLLLSTMRSRKSVEEEEELSVEGLLQSTPDIDLDAIEEEGKSEAYRLVEKFVDENPESVANLLRNWLREDWG